MLGSNSCARRQNFDVKAERLGFDIGDKIRTDVFPWPLTNLPYDRALPGHDSRIGAERAALRRDLRGGVSPPTGRNEPCR